MSLMIKAETILRANCSQTFCYTYNNHCVFFFLLSSPSHQEASSCPLLWANYAYQFLPPGPSPSPRCLNSTTNTHPLRNTSPPQNSTRPIGTTPLTECTRTQASGIPQTYQQTSSPYLWRTCSHPSYRLLISTNIQLRGCP